MQIVNDTVSRFVLKVRKWQMNSWDQDVVISRSLELLWIKGRKETIQEPDRWLLTTAKYIRKETQRDEVRRREVINECRASLGTTSRHNGELMTTSRRQETKSRTSIQDLTQSPVWSALDGTHRELFRLVFVEEQSTARAARELGINRSTAKSWIERDSRRLQQCPVLQRLAGNNHFPTYSFHRSE